MALAGFSINLITLFALVLVIGTVVDDAIIVVEAVQSKFDSGYRSPYMASVDAMKGLSVVLSSPLRWCLWRYLFRCPSMSGTPGTVLYPVRADDGGGRRYLRHQCVDAESGPLRLAAATLYQ